MHAQRFFSYPGQHSPKRASALQRPLLGALLTQEDVMARIIRRRTEVGDYRLMNSESGEQITYAYQVRASRAPYVGLTWFSIRRCQWYRTLSEIVADEEARADELGQ